MERKGCILAVTEKEFKNAFEGTDREVVYENDIDKLVRRFQRNPVYLNFK